MTRAKRPGRAVALVTALSLIVQPSVHVAALVGADRQTATKTAPPPPQVPPQTSPPATAKPTTASKPAASTSAAAAPVDGGWPRVYELASGGSVLVYQPQIASWDQQKRIAAFAAVSYRTKAADKPAIGTIKLEADTQVALTDRLVSFRQLKITEANFQTLPKEQLREVVAAIDQAIPDDDRVIALDRVLANLDKSQIVPKNVEGIKADPPAIFFSKTPAV